MRGDGEGVVVRPLVWVHKAEAAQEDDGDQLSGEQPHRLVVRRDDQHQPGEGDAPAELEHLREEGVAGAAGVQGQDEGVGEMQA